MHRRDILDLRNVARAAGHVLGALDELSPHAEFDAPQSDDSIPLLRLSRRAMATTFEVVLPYGTPNAMALGSDAFDLIDSLESQLTVYRETSEVSRLNRIAAYGPVPVEERLFGLLRLAACIHSETSGAFDVTAGALIKAWGFFKGPRRVPSQCELGEANVRVGMQFVELNADAHSVRFLRPGLEINLGGIGKGYALDRVAEYLEREWSLSSALLHGGYSSVVTMGCPPGEPRGWQVGITHPHDPGRRLATVWLRGRALGTSAATFQHLEYNGQRLGHILDPRRGWPASGIASATVIAPTGAEADALSTAFYIEGVEAARRYCGAHPNIGAVLLPDGDERLEVINVAPHEICIAACGFAASR
jgi:thiamine biosynthesis lipoprotein